MSMTHVALIVEDDPANADDLQEIVVSMGIEAILAANRREASRLLTDRPFCCVLLDLQIKDGPKSVKGHVSHGQALLDETRRLYGDNRKVASWVPVLVISGHAGDPETVAELMKNRADDVIQKPLKPANVVDRIRRALRAAGREFHAACTSLPARPLGESTMLLTIPGDQKGRRTRVSLGGTDVYLTDGELGTLLQLGIATLKGARASRNQLGGKPDEGFQKVSRLRTRLQPDPSPQAGAISVHRGAGYCLSDEVEIGECNARGLQHLGNSRIAEWAAEWERLRAVSPERLET